MGSELSSNSTSACYQTCYFPFGGTHPCNGRTQYERGRGHGLCDALGLVNAECVGQCHCTAADFGVNTPCTTSTTTTTSKIGCNFALTKNDDVSGHKWTIRGVSPTCALYLTGCFGSGGNNTITTPDPTVQYNAPCTDPAGCGPDPFGANTVGW